LGFGSRDKKVIESRRNSLWQMSETPNVANLAGILKVTSFPRLTESYQLNAHQFGVSKILVNKEDSLLFTVGQDNLICIYELQDKEFKAKRDRQNLTLVDANEFIYDEDKLIMVRIM
jgi:WD40 repeat protein